ncbi:MAG TPA: hypothetical protein VFS00_17005 [Polyangiaceae bacterium]|nr:hypothetical protein [Polyangiaceae bacterium]
MAEAGAPSVEETASPPAVAALSPGEAGGAGRESGPPPADAARASEPPAAGAKPLAAVSAPSERLRVVLNFDDAGPGDRTPPALSVDAAPPGRGVEDDHRSFFESADVAVAREREAVLALLREEAKAKAKAPPSAAQIARRRQARRLVTYVMGGAALLFGLGSLRVAWRERRAAPASALSQQVQAVSAVAAPPAEAGPSARPSPAVASALPAAGPALARELAARADQSFERRRYREAIEQASRAVGVDPSDAGAYLIWARALAETGQRAEAKRVFSRCLEQATKGPKDECSPGVR